MKFSIITPSYNQGPFIARTIDSVLSQDWDQIEYFVADGGSKDQTIDVLNKRGGGLRWISENDNGQADAVNKGIRATSGEIIGWLNSDDIYYPGAIHAVAEFFAANPEIDIIYGGADHIDENDKVLEPYPAEPWDFNRLFETCFICQPALFFRRRVTEKCGLLDDKLQYCMDYEYWLRLAAQGVRFAFLDRRLAGSRLYAANKTLGSRQAVHAEINDMFAERFGKVPDKWIFAYSHAALDQRMSRAEHPRRYVMNLATLSLASAVRWNRSISLGVLHRSGSWLVRALFKHRP